MAHVAVDISLAHSMFLKELPKVSKETVKVLSRYQVNFSVDGFFTQKNVEQTLKILPDKLTFRMINLSQVLNFIRVSHCSDAQSLDRITKHNRIVFQPVFENHFDFIITLSTLPALFLNTNFPRSKITITTSL